MMIQRNMNDAGIGTRVAVRVTASRSGVHSVA